MSKTLNQVIQSQSDFAVNHQQINHFFFGEEWDFATSGTVNCPAMISVLQPIVVQGSVCTYSFKIYFGDIVHKDLSNKNEVLSDMHQLAMDFIGQFQHPDYDWVFETDNITLNDFEDSFECELYGFWLIAKLKVAMPFDRCAIPQINSMRNFADGNPYSASQNGLFFRDIPILTGAVNGTNAVFTFGYAPVQVYYNGQLLKEGTGYTLSGLTITLLITTYSGELLWAYGYR